MSEIDRAIRAASRGSEEIASLRAELAAMTNARDLLAATAERLIAERNRYRAALREIKRHGETCEDDAELCRRDWVPMEANAALRRR